MSILNAQIRDASSKGNQLRKEGIIPAVLFGKHLEESICIQIAKKDVGQFLRFNSRGSKLDLMIGEKKYMALLKDVVYTSEASLYEHVSFQAMTAGEKIASVAHVVLINEENVEGLVQNLLTEIHYKAIPSHIVEKIEVDLAGMKAGDNIRVADLEFSKNKDIELQSLPETLVVSISPLKAFEEETPIAGDDKTAVTAEAPVGNEKKKSD